MPLIAIECHRVPLIAIDCHRLLPSSGVRRLLGCAAARVARRCESARGAPLPKRRDRHPKADPGQVILIWRVILGSTFVSTVLSRRERSLSRMSVESWAMTRVAMSEWCQLFCVGRWRYTYSKNDDIYRRPLSMPQSSVEPPQSSEPPIGVSRGHALWSTRMSAEVLLYHQ